MGMSIYVCDDDGYTPLYMGSYSGLGALHNSLHSGVGEILQYDETEKHPGCPDTSVVTYDPDWTAVKAAALAEIEKQPAGKQSFVSQFLKDVLGHAERAEERNDVFIQFCW